MELTKIAVQLEEEMPIAGSSGESVLGVNVLSSHQPGPSDVIDLSSHRIIEYIYESEYNPNLDLSSVFDLLVQRLHKFDYMVKFIIETKSEYDAFEQSIEEKYDILRNRYVKKNSGTADFKQFKNNHAAFLLTESIKNNLIENMMTAIKKELEIHVSFTSKLVSAKNDKKIKECIKKDRDILSSEQYENHKTFITDIRNDFDIFTMDRNEWKTKIQNYEQDVTSNCRLIL